MVEYIGIDLGGTNIRVGAIDENENLIFEYKESTFKDVKTGEDLCNKIKNMIKKVPEYESVKGIGLGVPGAVDITTSRITTAKNVEILKDYPLVEELKKEFNKPIYIDNDAKVATLAEAVGGKGKDKNIVCYVTISTGLGGGVVVNNKIYHGSNSLGGYFSRIIVDGNNTSDSTISGRALLEQARLLIDENIQKASEVFEIAKQGNKEAEKIVETFKHNLLILLLNISVTINPDIIVLGGGVLNAKEYFLDDVINSFRNNAHILAKDTIIDVAKYEEPGIVGACFLAKYFEK